MKFTIYDLRFTPRSSRGEEPLTHSFLTGRTASDVQPFQPPVRSKPLRRIDASTLQPGFTLIELLVVIAIAVVISALLITAGAAVVRKSNINRAISEREQIETAIDNYHATFGYYPPSNPNGPLTNQLYYELLGTSTNATGFETLDDASQISAATVQSTFGVSAFMNCNKGSGEDAVPAHMFLAGLK
ncbi:MAG TPA: type II secretion system protein, partial [Verrucomicrobiae bacterium]|nr:type II secretion system protein [Verrucomicrobiae bacterium]